MGKKLVFSDDGLSVRLVNSDGTDASTKDPSWVTFEKIFDTDAVPPDAAEVIRAGLRKMLAAGLVSQDAAWQSIEFLFAEFLATPDIERRYA